MDELIQKYLEKMNVRKEELFSHSKANKLMNEHVMSYYKKRVNLRDEKEYTGIEIAEKLAIIEDNFTKQFEEAWAKEFGEEEEEE